MQKVGSCSRMRRSLALACALLVASFGTCACSAGNPSGSSASTSPIQDDDRIAANSEEEIEIPDDQLVMKVSGAEDFAVPLDEVTVTLYDASRDGASFDNAIKRLMMMGIEHIRTKEPTGTDSSIVAYRAPEYRPIAELMSEDLRISCVLEIENDGTNGWSYDTDIAIVIAD